MQIHCTKTYKVITAYKQIIVLTEEYPYSAVLIIAQLFYRGVLKWDINYRV